MSNFKDQVAADIAAAFLNEDEFADMHTVDGRQILCVITSSNNDQYAANADEGLWISTKTLSAKTSELAALPKGMPQANRVLRIDGKAYRVLSVSDAMGITRITMELVLS